MNKNFTFKINLAENTLTLNYKCNRMANVHGSPEYNKVRQILAENPGMKLVVEAGRHNKTCHHDKNLTYKNMETYISIQPNADELMAAYWIARTESAPQTSRYAYVRKWFISQFPKYDEIPVFSDSETSVVEMNAECPAPARAA